jgi:aminopeptidase N
MRNQAFKAYIKVLVLLFVAACSGNSPNSGSPTSILPTLVAPAWTPTTAWTPTAVTDTLATESAPVATPTLVPTNTPVPQADVSANAGDSQAVVANGRSIGDPYAPELGNSGYDVKHYAIDISIDPSQTAVEAVVTIEAVLTENSLENISFDFIGFDIQQVLVNGNVVQFAREDDKLVVDVNGIVSGQSVLIVVSYSGTPLSERSRFVAFAPSIGMRFVDDAQVYVLSEPDGSRYWFPNNDHPRDKATFDFVIMVPEGLTAVANGRLVDVEKGQDLLPNGAMGDTYRWSHLYPMATYLATIVVGDYERVESKSPKGIPIRSYVFADHMDAFERANVITGEAVDWMSDLFGPYPFENIGFVTADAPGVSLETQTIILLSTSMIGQQTVLHELAHMWFGNWVSLDSWSEMWRNEGFATYVTLMWAHRDDPEGLELEIEAIKTAVAENEPQYPLGSPPPQYLFGFNTYFKGAVMIHELRQTVGDDAFFAGLQAYFQEYGGGSASDAEFQAVMEKASGISLDAFFVEWLK